MDLGFAGERKDVEQGALRARRAAVTRHVRIWLIWPWVGARVICDGRCLFTQSAVVSGEAWPVAPMSAMGSV